MIVIADALALAPTAGNPLNTPIFGWRSIAASVTATTEADGFRAANLLNPSTALRWKADPGSPPADEYLTVPIDAVDPVDYLAIAVHNLGTGQNAVSVEHLDATQSPEAWEELVGEHLLANDDPALFRFAPQSLTAIRLRIQPGTGVPMVAVLHVGKLLVLERGTHTDHIPINKARTARVMTGKSETGNFLGRDVLSESRSTTFALQHLRAAWYDQYMDPFIAAANDLTFFFAWKPQERPRDVGYCWLTGDPQPTDQFGVGTKAISLQLGGVAV